MSKHTRYMVMGYLALHGMRPTAEIAKDLSLDPKTVRMWVDRLSRHGTPSPKGTTRNLVPTTKNLAPPLFPSNGKPATKISEGFREWWSVYPVSRNRARAYEIWKRMKLEPSKDALIQALRWQIKRKKEIEDRGEFVADFPYAQKYLKEKRWHDKF